RPTAPPRARAAAPPAPRAAGAGGTCRGPSVAPPAPRAGALRDPREPLDDRPREGGDRVLRGHDVGGQAVLGGGGRRDGPDRGDRNAAAPRPPLRLAEHLGEVSRGG